MSAWAEDESYLLGCVFADNNIAEDVFASVMLDDFCEGRNRLIFEAMRTAAAEGVYLEPHAVNTKVKAHVDVDYLYSLASIIPSGANWMYYAKRMRESALKRRLRKLGLEIAEAAKNGEEADQIRKRAELEVFELGQAQHARYLDSKGVAMIGVKKIEERFYAKGELEGVPSGFSDLDRVMGGFRKAELVTIGARPSIGKSAFALSLAINAASKVPVGFISLEMSDVQLGMRLFSMVGRIDMGKLQIGEIKVANFSRISDTGGKIADLPLYFYDRPNARVSDIITAGRRMVRLNRIGVLFVDYGGLIELDSTRNRAEAVSDMVRQLKALARELDIPVVLLAQVNRGAEGKSPTLADLKESGGYEEHSDVVLLLHRDRLSESQNVRTEVVVAKNRQGATGTVVLAFVPRYTRFEEFAR